MTVIAVEIWNSDPLLYRATKNYGIRQKWWKIGWKHNYNPTRISKEISVLGALLMKLRTRAAKLICLSVVTAPAFYPSFHRYFTAGLCTAAVD